MQHLATLPPHALPPLPRWSGSNRPGAGPRPKTMRGTLCAVGRPHRRKPGRKPARAGGGGAAGGGGKRAAVVRSGLGISRMRSPTTACHRATTRWWDGGDAGAADGVARCGRRISRKNPMQQCPGRQGRDGRGPPGTAWLAVVWQRGRRISRNDPMQQCGGGQGRDGRVRTGRPGWQSCGSAEGEFRATTPCNSVGVGRAGLVGSARDGLAGGRGAARKADFVQRPHATVWGGRGRDGRGCTRGCGWRPCRSAKGEFRATTPCNAERWRSGSTGPCCLGRGSPADRQRPDTMRHRVGRRAIFFGSYGVDCWTAP